MANEYLSREDYEAQNPGKSYEDYQTSKNQKQQYDAYEMMMGVPPTEAVDYDAMYGSMADMYEKISQMNLEKFESYWPKSIEEGISAGEQFDTAGRAAAGRASAYNMQLADQMNNWLANLSKYGNAFMRDEATKSNKWIMDQVGDVNKFNSEEFYTALETAMPGVRDTVSDYKKTVDQMLSGELPDSVKSEIAQTAAERGLSTGMYGPAYDNAQLRDLGLSRLQYVQAGQAQMGQLSGIAGQMMAPVATPNIYQNVMMTPTPYTPQPTYAQPSNVPGIAGNYLSSIMGGTMMQPQAGIGAAVQMGGVQAQINQANTQLQYSKAMSGLNYGMDQQAQAQNYEMFKQQMNAQQEQQWWNLGGSILGAAGKVGAAFAMPGL